MKYSVVLAKAEIFASFSPLFLSLRTTEFQTARVNRSSIHSVSVQRTVHPCPQDKTARLSSPSATKYLRGKTLVWGLWITEFQPSQTKRMIRHAPMRSVQGSVPRSKTDAQIARLSTPRATMCPPDKTSDYPTPHCSRGRICLRLRNPDPMKPIIFQA